MLVRQAPTLEAAIWVVMYVEDMIKGRAAIKVEVGGSLRDLQVVTRRTSQV